MTAVGTPVSVWRRPWPWLLICVLVIVAGYTGVAMDDWGCRYSQHREGSGYEKWLGGRFADLPGTSPLKGWRVQAVEEAGTQPGLIVAVDRCREAVSVST